MNRDHLADLFMPGIRGKINQLNELTQYLENIPAAIRNYSGWQPIETAPKDGTKVLLYIVSDDDGDNLSFIDVGRWEILIDGEGRWDSIFEYGDEATHWQPLPKPPQEEI